MWDLIFACLAREFVGGIKGKPPVRLPDRGFLLLNIKHLENFEHPQQLLQALRELYS